LPFFAIFARSCIFSFIFIIFFIFCGTGVLLVSFFVAERVLWLFAFGQRAFRCASQSSLGSEPGLFHHHVGQDDDDVDEVDFNVRG